MINIIILLVALAAAYFAWKFVSQHFMKKGNKKFVSHLAGISTGFFAFIIVLVSFIQTQPQIKGQAHQYKVVNEYDYSFPGRNRRQWTITAPTALTKEDRALTAIQAAKDLQAKTDADQAYVLLAIDGLKSSHGLPLATAAYTPDGKGNSGKTNSDVWEVEASDKHLTQLEKNIVVLWENNKKNFLKEDGVLTDEKKLSQFIAKELNISVDEVNMPYITREKISYHN